MSNQLSRRHVYIDETTVFVPAPREEDGRVAADGTREHLNATLAPDALHADTAFAYLTTDGSDDAPYLGGS